MSQVMSLYSARVVDLESRHSYLILLASQCHNVLLITWFILMYAVWLPSLRRGGHRYYVIFIDDFSRYTWLYFMTSRSDVLSLYKFFSAMVHSQYSTPIREF
jgi:hypothetical protein